MGHLSNPDVCHFLLVQYGLLRNLFLYISTEIPLSETLTP